MAIIVHTETETMNIRSYIRKIASEEGAERFAEKKREERE